MADPILELVAWLHVLGAIAWFGGILTLEFVISPTIKKSETSNKANIMMTMGKQVGVVVGVSASLVFITGLLRVWYTIGFDLNLLISTLWGNILVVKVILFFIFGALGGSMGKKLGTITSDTSNEKVLAIFDQIKTIQILDVIVGAIIILLAVLLRYTPV